MFYLDPAIQNYLREHKWHDTYKPEYSLRLFLKLPDETSMTGTILILENPIIKSPEYEIIGGLYSPNQELLLSKAVFLRGDPPAHRFFVRLLGELESYVEGGSNISPYQELYDRYKIKPIKSLKQENAGTNLVDYAEPHFKLVEESESHKNQDNKRNQRSPKQSSQENQDYKKIRRLINRGIDPITQGFSEQEIFNIFFGQHFI